MSSGEPKEPRPNPPCPVAVHDRVRWSSANLSYTGEVIAVLEPNGARGWDAAVRWDEIPGHPSRWVRAQDLEVIRG